MKKLALLAALAFTLALLLVCTIGFMARVAYIRSKTQEALRCPHCGGSDVRPSYPAAFPDGLFARFSCFPFRCRACSCRFFRAKA